MNYEPPDVTEFFEVRRGLPMLAAVLFVVALVFPMWIIDVKAIQYPGTTLHLRVYAYPRIAGDYAEMASLNKYIGFYYPDPVYWQPNYEPHPYAVDVPEWSIAPFAFVAVSALSIFVALAPDVRRLKRGITAQFVGTAAVFGVMVADIQYRLWQAGHTLDPGAPVMGIDGFTPPIVGTYKVANITSFSHFGLGAYMSMAAVGALAVAFYYRDTAVRFADLPERVRSRIEGLRRRIFGDDGSDGESGDAVGTAAPGGDGEVAASEESDEEGRSATDGNDGERPTATDGTAR